MHVAQQDWLDVAKPIETSMVSPGDEHKSDPLTGHAGWERATERHLTRPGVVGISQGSGTSASRRQHGGKSTIESVSLCEAHSASQDLLRQRAEGIDQRQQRTYRVEGL